MSVLAALIFGGFLFILKTPTIQAANPGIISFQGKVVNPDGTNVTNGSYNFDFVMYDDASLGTPSDGVHDKWHELTKSVTVTNGVFQTNLGSATALPDFNANPSLYLAIRFNADAAGYMTPRVQMASVAYALNADKVGGIAASGLVQLNATQSGNINLTAGNISTSGTIGNSGTTTFTGGIATFSGNVSLGSVGTSTAASTVNIANTTDGTGTQTISIGSTAKAANILTLQAGGALSSLVLQTGSSGGIDIGANNVANKTINIGSVGATAQSSTVHIADSSGAAQTVTIGSGNSTSATTIQGGSGNINLSPSAGNDVVFAEGAGSNLQISASAAPTVDQLTISNAGQGVVTSNVDGLSVNFVGGAAAVEAAGTRVDLTPGGTSGGVWSGLRIVANGTGPVSGVTEYGVKIEGPTSQGAGTETGMYIGSGWDTGLDVQSGGLNLAGYTSGGSPSDPATPAADNLRVYSKKVSGRMLLKIKGPSGVDNPLQPALFGNNIILFTPTSGTTATGGFGTLWAKGSSTGTASTPTPSSTAPAMTNQMHRFRHQNVVTTTNQIMGLQVSGADGNQFWRGNAAGLGGFFFNARFIVEAYPAATVRIFAGLTSNATSTAVGTNIVTADAVVGDVAGLWHDTTDASTTFNFLTRNNTTSTKAAITLSNAIAAGNSYDFFMFCAPNDSTIYYRLDDMVNGVTYEGNTATTVPRNTIFMGPTVEISNGTANTAAGGTAIGINRIYVESDH